MVHLNIELEKDPMKQMWLTVSNEPTWIYIYTYIYTILYEPPKCSKRVFTIDAN